MITTSSYRIAFPGTADALWNYEPCAGPGPVAVRPPEFEIEGQAVTMALRDLRPVCGVRTLANGVSEHRWRGTCCADAGLGLELVFRCADASPVVRFAYTLHAAAPRRLTRAGGRDRLVYFGVDLAALPCRTEIRLSEFDESVHSFRLTEREVRDTAFANGLAVMGPLLAAGDGRRTLLAAYEHGSTSPDAFVQFRLAANGAVRVEAVKGNYWHGRALGPDRPFETLWCEAAMVAGGLDELAAAYREFVLKHLSCNRASRQPYIFYNTWAFQERNKWWHGHAYLDSMNADRILAEIDVAHRMGIEVFVLDTGWYEKTGDWRVSTRRFPDGLRAVRAKLAGYGMKLGLWFSPTQAAVSSRPVADHPGCRMSWDGRLHGPHEVWETEASYNMCLASRYWEGFADELIRLHRELGVVYFKWDAVGQYGCNDAGHWHGDASVPPQERADCYAFEQVRYMVRVVDRLCAACPEAIVDFDITEGGRSVGLAFLSAGKYFLINNGPYFPNLDHPYDWATATVWSNVYVYPGPARARVCRAPLTCDRWLPSVLFLTHYLPDEPARSQWINLASLILGQNGIWGDLLSLSPAGVERFGQTLALYKQVRDDITEAPPVRTGAVGGNPEIHEKVSPRSGRGAVALFASSAGSYTYITEARVARGVWTGEGVTVTFTPDGRARLEASFTAPGATLAFFGVSATGLERPPRPPPPTTPA